uniref:Uncharacterized protein n=1 Tax=viral metagenome TaxID=1070528 RepID=A0A6C0KS29_9ZZZZ
MTTPYGITTSIGSQTFAGFVNAPIGGPLDTGKYPNIIPYHNYGILTGKRPTPPQFYPGQEPVYAEMDTNARARYLRATALSPQQKAIQDALGKLSVPITKVAYSSQRQYAVSSHMNYIEPIPSSMHTSNLKSISVGKSAYKVGLPLEAPIGSKSYDTSFRRTALRRARSGGCTAPRKKGSIYNYSLTQPGICAWGSLPRQNY